MNLKCRLGVTQDYRITSGTIR